MMHNIIKNEKLEKKMAFNNKFNDKHSFRNNHLNSNKLKKIKIDNISFLTEFELNLLEYNIALKIDKRRIFQFYWSFLKRGNIIFYAIMPYDDYDLRTTKITLLLKCLLYLFSSCFIIFPVAILRALASSTGSPGR